MADNETSKFHDYALVELEQTPLTESSLLSIDEKSQDVLALVGGYDFARSQFNRVLQAARQTGSSFKAIVYAAALDKGYTPATPIIDSPVVYEEKDEGQDADEVKSLETEKRHEQIQRRHFVPQRFDSLDERSDGEGHRKHRRPWATTYARRLGIFSPLNNDFTMALGLQRRHAL